MNRMAAVALNTFKETIRDRVLLVIVVFALAMIVAALWLASISLGETARMMQDFGLVAVTAFGVIVAVFVAGTLVRKEVEKRTVFVVFSKPVRRGEFITGKFLGLSLTMAVVLAGMGAFLFLLTWLVGGVSGWMLLAATGLVYLQVLVVVAVTIFFSTFSSALLASVLGICIFAAGQLSHNVLSLSRLGDSALLKGLSWAIYLLIPNFSAVDIKPGVVGEATAAWGDIALWSGYLAAYAMVALVIATLVFNRREF